MKNNFYITLLIIGLITSAIIAGLQHTYSVVLINPYIWAIQGYMIAITAAAYYISNKGLTGHIMDFQNYALASIGIRFLISAVIIFSYIYAVKVNGMSFLINFFILYLIYSVFEIKSVLSNLRAHLDNDKK